MSSNRERGLECPECHGDHTQRIFTEGIHQWWWCHECGNDFADYQDPVDNDISLYDDDTGYGLDLTFGETGLGLQGD